MVFRANGNRITPQPFYSHRSGAPALACHFILVQHQNTALALGLERHPAVAGLPAAPGDLAQATLLRSLAPWQPWLAAAGLPLAEPAGGVLYEDLSMLIRSAIDGDGVALVRHAIVLQELAEGRLVRLFDLVAPSKDAYYLVSPPAAAGREPVVAFSA